jgi:RimK family alpha-L-glutamate ligase
MLELLRLAIRTTSPRLIIDGEAVPKLHGAIIRLGSVLPGLAVAAGRALEHDAVTLLDRVDPLLIARDKMESLQRLSLAGVPVVETELVRDLDQLGAAVDRLGGAPVVLKPLYGSQGRGAVLAESRAGAISMMESVLFQSREFILQRYIECGGQDIRVVVIDGEVVASMQRTAPPGDFRSNLHRGGVASRIEATTYVEELALRAAQVLGLRCCGVDILHASQRRFWEAEFPEVDGENGLNTAGWAKKLTGLPTITVGSVGLSSEFTGAMRGEGSKTRPITDVVERLEKGEFDLVAVGRALLQDPEWATKVKDGRTEELADYDAKAMATLY